MTVLIAYDINTESNAGKGRLRRVARLCANHGMRVQNSLFECQISGADLEILKAELHNIVNEDTDSIRIYFLNEKSRNKTICIGVHRQVNVYEDILIL